MKTFKELSEKLKKDKDDPCWKGYVQLGTKKKNGKEVPNCVPKENVEEKAVSKQQQKFMGMVRAVQKGEMDAPSPEVAKAAKSMSKKDVKDFAKTKHKGLPVKKESVKEALTLSDIRRKKEREEKRKRDDRAGETQHQRMMRKVYGNMMGGLKKEEVELEEGRGEALKAFESLVKRGGIDRATFQKAHDLYKGAKFAELKKLIANADTDVSEAIADLIQRHDSKAFNSMYPKAKSGDYLRNITKENYIAEAKSFGLGDRVRVKDDAKKVVNRNLLGKSGVIVPHGLGGRSVMVKFPNGQSAMFTKTDLEMNEARKSGANYEVYHKDFSTAVQYAKREVEKKGYEIDDDEWFRKVASGPRKPSVGKTNSYNIELMKNGKPTKQRLQMQVYGMDSGKYELNMYVS